MQIVRKLGVAEWPTGPPVSTREIANTAELWKLGKLSKLWTRIDFRPSQTIVLRSTGRAVADRWWKGVLRRLATQIHGNNVSACSDKWLAWWKVSKGNLYLRFRDWIRETAGVYFFRPLKQIKSRLCDMYKQFGTHDTVRQSSSQGRSLQHPGLDNLLGQCEDLAERPRQDGANKKCPR